MTGSRKIPHGASGNQTQGQLLSRGTSFFFLFFLFFFCVPQLYLWGSPLLGEIFAYVTVF